MDLSELQKFNQSNFMLIKSLGSGSYGYVQLLYHKKLNQFLVQKSFFLVEVKKSYQSKFLMQKEKLNYFLVLNTKILFVF